MTIKFYLVGGAVRDSLLGLPSKDLDYSVEAPSFATMREEIVRRGGEIFLEQEQYLTIRAKVPVLGISDFVLARKDGDYKDGRRPESVTVGTILDDLARRDFTVNAIAKDEAGNIIDPFNGQYDLGRKVLKCVGDARKRFTEDKLRLLRAFRFSITKDFSIAPSVAQCMNDEVLVDKLNGVSVERIREELLKCFAHDTAQTFYLFREFPLLFEACFESNNGLRLEPTLKKK